MEDGIQGLDPRQLDARLLGEAYGRAEEGLHLHRAPRDVVLPHDTLGRLRFRHVVDGLLLEFGSELAALGGGESQQFVDDIRDELEEADLVEERSMARRLEDDAGRVKSDGTKDSYVSLQAQSRKGKKKKKGGGREKKKPNQEKRKKTKDH